jgi:hypothetical protein
LGSDDFTRGAIDEYSIENVALEGVILRRHLSELAAGHNCDPDVEQCLIAPGSGGLGMQQVPVTGGTTAAASQHTKIGC